MDNQTKVIFILLAIVLILSIIMGLKIAGVIKPSQKPKKTVEEQNVIDEKTDEIEIEESYNNNLFLKILRFIIMHLNLIGFGIVIFTSIGSAKLYKKINMPDWAINFYYMYPIIALVMGFMPRIIEIILSSFVGLTALSCICKFFGCLEMSEWWPLAGIAGTLLILLGLGKGVIKIFLIIGILLILSYVYAHVVSSIRLARKEDRGIGFTIGLILLPTIFKPILGYLK
jgi:hypothetical protein